MNLLGEYSLFQHPLLLVLLLLLPPLDLLLLLHELLSEQHGPVAPEG